MADPQLDLSARHQIDPDELFGDLDRAVKRHTMADVLGCTRCVHCESAARIVGDERIEVSRARSGIEDMTGVSFVAGGAAGPTASPNPTTSSD